MPGCHWRFIRTCYAIRGFCFGEYGNRYATYPGLSWARNIRHTVWYTASNAGRFYGIGIEPEDDSVTLFYRDS